jgi:predicted lipoprotein with Yx(FWY)xxD motif
MRISSRIAAAGFAFAIAGTTAATAVTAATAAPMKATGTKMTLHHASQGKVLVGAGKKFVYVHVDAAGKDVGCSAVCQQIWPVVTTHGKPRAGHGVKKSKLGAKGGQVTYAGHLLWYYSPQPKDSSVDGANSFGGDWRLINAKGKFR